MFEGNHVYTIGADPAIEAKYVQRMYEVNRQIISRSYYSPVSLFSFQEVFARVREIAVSAQVTGDAILVADGPKPIVLACSLIPWTVKQPGVVTVHVGSGLIPFQEPRNIRAQGTVIGFEITFRDGDHGLEVVDMETLARKDAARRVTSRSKSSFERDS